MWQQRLTLVAMLLLLVSGCSSANKSLSDSGICDGLSPLVAAHTDALLKDGGPKSLVTGQRLIAGFDGGCDV